MKVLQQNTTQMKWKTMHKYEHYLKEIKLKFSFLFPLDSQHLYEINFCLYTFTQRYISVHIELNKIKKKRQFFVSFFYFTSPMILIVFSV